MSNFHPNRLRTSSCGLLLALAIAIASVAGCGKPTGLDKVVVHGTVTLDGQPISNGEIRFIPAPGTAGPISGGPIKDGAYVAEGRGGVPLGDHQVEIRAFRVMAKGPGQSASANPEGGPAEQYLDKRYNEQTTLKATIAADTETQDFQLTSK
jgi:hypothetical protein